MMRFTSTVAAFLTTVFALTSNAWAQTPAQQTPSQANTLEHSTGTSLLPTWEASFGYQMLHVPDQTFPFGINVDGARNFGPWGLAAELGWAYRSDSDDVFDQDVKTNVLHGGAGPRWSGRNNGRVWPFAQALAGFAYARSSTDLGNVNVSDSSTNFMLQPGAGVVILAGDGWGFVAQADYRRVFTSEDETGESGQNDFRTYFGIRVILD